MVSGSVYSVLYRRQGWILARLINSPRRIGSGSGNGARSAVNVRIQCDQTSQILLRLSGNPGEMFRSDTFTPSYFAMTCYSVRVNHCTLRLADQSRQLQSRIESQSASLRIYCHCGRSRLFLLRPVGLRAHSSHSHTPDPHMCSTRVVGGGVVAVSRMKPSTVSFRRMTQTEQGSARTL